MNSAELFEILDYIANDDYIFRWLDFICTKIPLVARQNSFLAFLKKIIIKIKNDMAQGNFIRALIEIGVQDQKLGVSLYRQMVATEDPDLIAYSSFPLGGAGKKKFNEVFALIEESFCSQNPEIKAAGIKTIRVHFREIGSINQIK